MWLSQVFRYPVKSLGGEAPASAAVEARGLAGDRRWMVVDPDGRFVTRRETPAMALVDARPHGGGIVLSHAAIGACVAPVPDDDAPTVAATVWRDRVSLRLGNAAADAFLSRALDRPVRLGYQHDDSRRAIDPRHARPGDHVSLADGFPLLVVTEASLGALNARLDRPVGIDRFRPNLVVAGAAPWAEDRWRAIRVGEVVLRIARPCSRCVVVTQQPRTGERLDGNEPLATLRAMGRMAPGGIMFGQNAVPERVGTLHAGDPVVVLEYD